MDKKVIIGLDLGPTSIGISSIDEDGKILTKTSILRISDNYDKTGTKTSAADRRQYRCTRRRYNRKKTLKRDFKKLANEYFDDINFDNLFVGNNKDTHIYEIKRDLILSNKNISTNDFIRCLYHYLDKKGCFYGGVDLKEKLPIQHLFDEIYSKKGCFKFNKLEEGKASLLKDDRINHKDYIKEIDQYFIDNFYKLNNLNDGKYQKFKTKYLKLFDRHRSYEYGPGNAKTPTKYGLCYQNIKNNTNEKLFDKLLGTCSIFPNEKRSIKNVSFEIFNFLEYINNHRYVNKDTGKVNSFEDKRNIFKFLVENTCNLSNKILEKLGVEVNRFNEEKKIEYKKEKFNHLFFYKKHCKTSDFKLFIDEQAKELNIEFINKLNDIDEQIKNAINLSAYDESNNKYDIDAFNESKEKWQKIADQIGCTPKDIYEEYICPFGKKLFNTCKLSRKALNTAISKLYQAAEKGANLQKVRTEYEKEFGYNQEVSINKLISQINTPNVKRIVTLTMQVLEQYILQNNFNKNDIVLCVETTNSYNNAKEKEKIKKINKINRDANEQILKDNPNISRSELLKHRLYEECGGVSVYTNQEIDRNNLNNYEIDHIYDYEWSADNSFNNKVLVEINQNSNKGKKTVAKFLGLEKQQYYIKNNKAWENIKGKNPKKYQKLINPELNYQEICKQEGFVGRNLSDTSYISSLVEQILRKKFDFQNVVRTNGKITNTVRNTIYHHKDDKNNQIDLDFILNNYEKNRLNYKHHGIDAISIAYSYFFNNHIKSNINKEYLGDSEIPAFKKILLLAKNNHVREYIDTQDNFNFWTPIYHKIKKDFFNRTLYSYKKINDEYYCIKKIKLMELTNKEIDKFFSPSKKTQFFMYHSEKDLFETIEKIYHDYKDISNTYKINSFQYYMNEINDTINNEDGKKMFDVYDTLEIYSYKNKKLSHQLKIRILKYMSKKHSSKDSFYSPTKQYDEKNGKKQMGGYTTFPFQRLLIYKEKQESEWEVMNLAISLVDKTNKTNNYLKEFSSKRKSIIENSTSYIDIFKGQKIILKDSESEFEIRGVKICHKTIYEISSFANDTEFIEIKSISKDIHKMTGKRLTLSYKKLLTKFDFLKLDLLGNIVKRINF